MLFASEAECDRVGVDRVQPVGVAGVGLSECA